jgi:hypothetical protein
VTADKPGIHKGGGFPHPPHPPPHPLFRPCPVIHCLENACAQEAQIQGQDPGTGHVPRHIAVGITIGSFYLPETKPCPNSTPNHGLPAQTPAQIRRTPAGFLFHQIFVTFVRKEKETRTQPRSTQVMHNCCNFDNLLK